ncbi:MAG: glycosyl hydrolase [Candidatus Neomarinimicrobiota bacterium]|nr:glycosyl hydrolase [Candidatus Neomarinimicrobiota bacterium]
MVMIEEKPALVFVREEISEIILLVSTDKGAFLYFSDADRRHWDVSGPHFMGATVHHLVLDPRDNNTLLASVQSRISGNIIYRSTNFGKSWEPANKQPKFKKNKLNRVIDHVFCLMPGHDEEKKCWYAGTSPQGLFRSEDGGNNWEAVTGFNDNENWESWTKKSDDGYPKVSKLHSIIINSSNKNHMYIGMSYGGVFQTLDAGKKWTPINDGLHADYMKNKNSKFGHDPHSVISHPYNPDRLYQQNHCGIYKLDLPNNKWVRIGDNMPSDIGDIGFPIAIHPNDPNTIWVFPIDGTEMWSRVCPEGQPAIYCSKDGGESWFRQDIGLPMRNAWLTVLRKSLNTDSMLEAGIYFGTTSGSLWMSDNEGNSWRQIAIHLPRILSIETGKILKK